MNETTRAAALSRRQWSLVIALALLAGMAGGFIGGFVGGGIQVNIDDHSKRYTGPESGAESPGLVE